jgi:hypothetical protein
MKYFWMIVLILVAIALFYGSWIFYTRYFHLWPYTVLAGIVIAIIMLIIRAIILRQ